MHTRRLNSVPVNLISWKQRAQCLQVSRFRYLGQYFFRQLHFRRWALEIKQKGLSSAYGIATSSWPPNPDCFLCTSVPHSKMMIEMIMWWTSSLSIMNFISVTSSLYVGIGNVHSTELRFQIGRCKAHRIAWVEDYFFAPVLASSFLEISVAIYICKISYCAFNQNTHKTGPGRVWKAFAVITEDIVAQNQINLLCSDGFPGIDYYVIVDKCLMCCSWKRHTVAPRQGQ